VLGVQLRQILEGRRAWDEVPVPGGLNVEILGAGRVGEERADAEVEAERIGVVDGLGVS
jgi:hypothetical protein